ncbi:hypothetical protein [Microbispora sp. CA-102843]|uniref:hypothetical protein n=1 Tax=Microbispora sp. CA-102843 TaxID=3239952 RepID=UPI003D92104A
MLAPPEDWELVKGCITHDTMNTTYAEAPMVVKANPGDVRGKGYYLWADQKWAGAPAGSYMEQQLSPYWGKDLASGEWTPITWQTPGYDLANGVIRHGHVFALTQAEHAALRGADLSSVSVETPPATTGQRLGCVRLETLGYRVVLEPVYLTTNSRGPRPVVTGRGPLPPAHASSDSRISGSRRR